MREEDTAEGEVDEGRVGGASIAKMLSAGRAASASRTAGRCGLGIGVGEAGHGSAQGLEAAIDQERLLGYVAVVRNALLRKDLVYSPRRGLIDFTVPLFGGYRRRQYPLSSCDDE